MGSKSYSQKIQEENLKQLIVNFPIMRLFDEVKCFFKTLFLGLVTHKLQANDTYNNL